MNRKIEIEHPVTKEKKKMEILKYPFEKEDNTYRYKFLDENGEYIDENERFMKKEDFKDMYL